LTLVFPLGFKTSPLNPQQPVLGSSVTPVTKHFVIFQCC